jgi:hypothetical protein
MMFCSTWLHGYFSITSTEQNLSVAIRTGLFWRALEKIREHNGSSNSLRTWSNQKPPSPINTQYSDYYHVTWYPVTEAISRWNVVKLVTNHLFANSNIIQHHLWNNFIKSGELHVWWVNHQMSWESKLTAQIMHKFNSFSSYTCDCSTITFT